MKELSCSIDIIRIYSQFVFINILEEIHTNRKPSDLETTPDSLMIVGQITTVIFCKTRVISCFML